MISIIISSFNKEYYDKLHNNINKTIGQIDYEIIKIDNPGLMGICEAYNKGASRAIYPYLVFCHEDILFHSINWGNILCKIFDQDSKIGLVGVLGGKYKSAFNSGWGIPADNTTSSFMIGTHYQKSNLNKIKNNVLSTIPFTSLNNVPKNFIETNIYNENVVALDGLFLATKKSIFKDFKFDESLFKGFHCYDIDFSLQILQKYRVVVNYNILIEHLSTGSFNFNWFLETNKLHSKWYNYLPITNIKTNFINLIYYEYKAFESYFRICKNPNIGTSKSFLQLYNLKYIFKIGFINFIGIQFCLFIKFTNFINKKIFN
jgi:hypothetical protein